MSRGLFIIRYPNGDAEFYGGLTLPCVGDRLTKRNAEWIVARVDAHADGSATVDLVPGEVEGHGTWPGPFEEFI